MQSNEQSQNTRERSIAKVEKKLEEVEHKMEESSFAVEMVKSERKRANEWKKAFFVTLISAFLIIGFIIGCGVWLWNQYEYESFESFNETNNEVVVDGADGGTANYIGNDGDIING